MAKRPSVTERIPQILYDITADDESILGNCYEAALKECESTLEREFKRRSDWDEPEVRILHGIMQEAAQNYIHHWFSLATHADNFQVHQRESTSDILNNRLGNAHVANEYARVVEQHAKAALHEVFGCDVNQFFNTKKLWFSGKKMPADARGNINKAKQEVMAFMVLKNVYPESYDDELEQAQSSLKMTYILAGEAKGDATANERLKQFMSEAEKAMGQQR